MQKESECIKSEINRISNDVSSRICTAQVVVTLNGAVRQLIDNALDAGAKTIDIRVKNNGFESLEVVDDGCGIEMNSFPSLLTIVTRSEIALLGTKLRYDHSGSIIDQSNVARPVRKSNKSFAASNNYILNWNYGSRG
uniref:HATPase_c domain-containing protein n=1 Tax=Heterorhabditis bacteriophora TaxID=37862 RepID=A0A1I7WY48_HETBA